MEMDINDLVRYNSKGLLSFRLIGFGWRKEMEESIFSLIISLFPLFFSSLLILSSLSLQFKGGGCWLEENSIRVFFPTLLHLF